MNTANFLSIPATVFPDQEIMIFDGARFTYGQSLTRVRRLAAALAALGIKRGDAVAALDTNSHRYVEAYYAAATLGAVFVPINYRAKIPELRHMLRAAGASTALVGARYAETLAGLLPELPALRHVIGMDAAPPGDGPTVEDLIAGAAAEREESEIEEHDTTILMYTSGTTALPKGVMLTHHDFTTYVCGTVELADGTPRGTALVCVPLYHIAGATAVMTTLFAGRKIVLMPQFEATAWLRLVEKERVTHAFLVPTMVKQLLDAPDFARRDLSSLQSLSYGGAAMPLPVVRRAIAMFPPTVGFVNAFGQTETTSTLTVLGPEDHRLTGSAAETETKLRRLGSIGRPLPDVELRVVGEDGTELVRGEVGEIVVRTPRVMKGYAGDAAASGVDAGGWLHTRDMGWIDDAGYVFLAGRKDDMIIRGGENIAPAEVEATLQLHPAVEEAAVVGIPDVEWGQRVAAAVALRPGARVTAEELGEFCRARLASFKKPEVVRFFSALPKNPMGKILRREIRAALGDEVARRA
ncbi:MAG: class I adenylate-forming enzyme family protein [Candidatus Binatia bacterium]